MGEGTKTLHVSPAQEHALGPRTWLHVVLYWAGHLFFSAAFRTIWRLRVSGREHIPLTGGVIFASNHVSLADPPLVGSCIPRMIHFMAKQELFEIPVFGWIIRQVNAFPVKRVERDVGAFKTAQRLLLAGEAIILFPEGTRQRGGRLGRPKSGVGMLAVKTQCPVVPVYVHNADRLSSLKPLRVCFGRPLRAEADADYDAFSRRVMEAIADLKEECLGSQN